MSSGSSGSSSEAHSETFLQEHDSTIDTDYPVCTTMKQAAASIQENSFCILRVDDETVRCIEQANEVAKQFFLSNEPDKVRRYQRIIGGHLHGYNRLPSKFLFRAFCGNRHQPWPTTQFQLVSMELADQLNALVTDCWKELKSTVATSDDEPHQGDRDDDNKDHHGTHDKADRTPPPAKRVKCKGGKHDDNPLDYFFYHNENQKAINCSEHIDRGVLIVVCFSDVPGLQVAKPKGTHGEFVTPEEL